MCLFNQALKGVKNIYRDVASYDMSNDEHKQLCRESWEEKYKYLCIDRSKKRDQGRYRICSENKYT